MAKRANQLDRHHGPGLRTQIAKRVQKRAIRREGREQERTQDEEAETKPRSRFLGYE